MRTCARRFFALFCLLFIVQAQAQERPVSWHINAGYSLTSGTTSDFLDDGWMIGGGLSWRPREDAPFSLLADLHYSTYDATDKAIRLANIQADTIRIDDGDGDVWGLSVNGVYRVPFGTRARGYVTAGIGEYYRKIEMSQTVLVGGIYCDPWWGFCYPGVVPGQAIVEETSTTRFAWNVGFGVEFPISGAGAWFIDARYQRIETSEPTEFIPIQVGFRF